MEGDDSTALDDDKSVGVKTTTIEVISAINGSLYPVVWPEKELLQSSDFIGDLAHRIWKGVRPQMKFLMEEHLLSEGQTWIQLGQPQKISMALQAFTREFDEELLKAATDGATNQVQSLLDKCQDPNCDRDGATPLLRAIHSGHSELVSVLLHRRANCSAENAGGETPLKMAVLSGRPKIVKQLLEARASPTGTQSPLAFAVLRSDMETVRYLIEFGAETEKPLQKGRTALTLAAHQGDIHMIRCLLSAGAKVNQPDEEGLTTLTIAARRMQSELIYLLVEARADKDQAEYTGRTALAIAAHLGNAEAVRFLLAARADANIVDFDGATPADLARERGHTDLLHQLSLT